MEDTKKEVQELNYTIDEFRDGAVVLTCGEGGMEVDLVFASGATRGDPNLEKQRAILEFIVKAIEAYR